MCVRPRRSTCRWVGALIQEMCGSHAPRAPIVPRLCPVPNAVCPNPSAVSTATCRETQLPLLPTSASYPRLEGEALQYRFMSGAHALLSSPTTNQILDIAGLRFCKELRNAGVVRDIERHPSSKRTVGKLRRSKNDYKTRGDEHKLLFYKFFTAPAFPKVSLNNYLAIEALNFSNP